MKLYILFGQLIERYPGEYAPEALESLAIVPLAVDQSSIMKILRPAAADAIPAQVVPEQTRS